MLVVTVVVVVLLLLVKLVHILSVWLEVRL